MANTKNQARDAEKVAASDFVTGLARGVAGALLFALPMLMTMEMWYLGFYMARERLLLLMILNIPFSFFSPIASVSRRPSRGGRPSGMRPLPTASALRRAF